MISQRTRAVLDLLGNLVVVALQLFFEHSARHERRPGEEPVECEDACPADRESIGTDDPAAVARGPGLEVPRVDPRWFLVGLCSGVVYRAAYDRDVGGIRRSRWRRWLLTGGIWAVWTRLGLEDRSVSHSIGFGSSVGAVCYRIRYGLLGEPR